MPAEARPRRSATGCCASAAACRAPRSATTRARLGAGRPGVDPPRAAPRRGAARPAAGTRSTLRARSASSRAAYRSLGRSLVVWRAGDRAARRAQRLPAHGRAARRRPRARAAGCVCPWHGLALGARGPRALAAAADATTTACCSGCASTPATTSRDRRCRSCRSARARFIDSVIRVEAACDPRDVLANRLDPWHGVHFHPALVRPAARARPGRGRDHRARRVPRAGRAGRSRSTRASTAPTRARS